MKNKYIYTLPALLGVIPVFAQDRAPVMFDQQQDSVVAVPYTTLQKDHYVGAVSIITGDQLKKSTSPNVQSALSGLGFGFSGTGWQIRGNSRGGASDGPLVVIDGLRNRAMSSITVEEVEAVYILKDQTAKMLFGSKAANGVIMIETKRGTKEKTFSVSGEVGFQHAQYLPEYLDSYGYAKLYNQALQNDGQAPLYSEEDLEGYRTGVDPIKYPNVDFYDTFLKDMRNYYRGNVEMTGTEKNLTYFLNVGYYGDQGLQKVGPNNKFNRFNVRSNLQYKVNNYISAFADVAARWDQTDRSNTNNNAYITALSTHRPNEYPLFVGQFGDTDSLGMGNTGKNNLYGDVTRNGYTEEKVTFAQTNVGLNLDLNRVVKGLTAAAWVSYDSYTLLSQGKSLSYSRFQLQDDGSLLRVGTDAITGTEKKFSDNVFRNLGVTGQVNYLADTDVHDFSANLVFDLQQKQDRLTTSGSYDSPALGIDNLQDEKSINLGLRANYAFDNRYVIEGDASYMGSDKFHPDQRWGLFGAAGLAWNLHNEAFMEDVDWVNRLKVKGSYGIMGYDQFYNYMIFEDLYEGAGSVFLGAQWSGQPSYAYKSKQIANENFTFEKAEEFNIGLEASFLNNRLIMEANYFDEYRYDIPTEINSIYPGYLGYGGAAPLMNYNAISNHGVELRLHWGDRIGDFSYAVGVNAIYNKAVHDIREQAPTMYAHERIQGRPTDAMTGFISEGLYQNQGEIDAHGVTSSFGALAPGDIKFKDYIADGLINNYDAVVLGNNSPRFSGSINVNLEYKGLSLYVLGQGVAGYDKMLLSSNLYKSTGATKYSSYIEGTAIVNPETGNIQADATYPRLTSFANGHSYRNASYWMVKGDYFRLQAAQLAYELPESWVSKIKMQQLKVYVKADNLFTLSYVDDMDPAYYNAGITSNPTFRTYSLGLNLVF